MGFTTVLLAQQPKEGAIISLNEYNLEVKKGEKLEIPVQLVRSERFRRGIIDGLAIQQKTGIEASFSKVEDQEDLYILTIRATTIVAGTYPLIIKAEGRSAHKVKQSMIMLKVTEGKEIASTN